ncbi:MAG: HAD family phosphatase [Candidatus Micrarchaeota archaeon]
MEIDLDFEGKKQTYAVFVRHGQPLVEAIRELQRQGVLDLVSANGFSYIVRVRGQTAGKATEQELPWYFPYPIDPDLLNGPADTGFEFWRIDEDGNRNVPVTDKDGKKYFLTFDDILVTEDIRIGIGANYGGRYEYEKDGAPVIDHRQKKGILTPEQIMKERERNPNAFHTPVEEMIPGWLVREDILNPSKFQNIRAGIGERPLQVHYIPASLRPKRYNREFLDGISPKLQKLLPGQMSLQLALAKKMKIKAIKAPEIEISAVAPFAGETIPENNFEFGKIPNVDEFLNGKNDLKLEKTANTPDNFEQKNKFKMPYVEKEFEFDEIGRKDEKQDEEGKFAFANSNNTRNNEKSNYAVDEKGMIVEDIMPGNEIKMPNIQKERNAIMQNNRDKIVNENKLPIVGMQPVGKRNEVKTKNTRVADKNRNEAANGMMNAGNKNKIQKKNLNNTRTVSHAVANEKIKAIIFDLDGVLADSEKLHLQTFNEVFGKYGVKIEEKCWIENYTGRGSEYIVHHLVKKNNLNGVDERGLVRERILVFEKRVGEGKLKAAKGAVKLIKLAKKRKIKLIVASGGHKKNVKTQLKAIGMDELKYLGTEDVKKRKPNPEVFEKAVKMLGLRKEECIIVEDSKTGLEAAVAAKIKCILIGRHHPKKLRKKASFWASKLNTKKLLKLFASLC